MLTIGLFPNALPRYGVEPVGTSFWITMFRLMIRGRVSLHAVRRVQYLRTQLAISLETCLLVPIPKFRVRRAEREV